LRNPLDDFIFAGNFLFKSFDSLKSLFKLGLLLLQEELVLDSQGTLLRLVRLLQESNLSIMLLLIHNRFAVSHLL